MVSDFHERVFLVKQVVVQVSWGIPVVPVLVSIHCFLSFSRLVFVPVVLLDFQRNFCTKIEHNHKERHLKVLFNSFHLIGHTQGFHPQTKKLEPSCT